MVSSSISKRQPTQRWISYTAVGKLNSCKNALFKQICDIKYREYRENLSQGSCLWTHARMKYLGTLYTPDLDYVTCPLGDEDNRSKMFKVTLCGKIQGVKNDLSSCVFVCSPSGTTPPTSTWSSGWVLTTSRRSSVKRPFIILKGPRSYSESQAASSPVDLLSPISYRRQRKKNT